VLAAGKDEGNLESEKIREEAAAQLRNGRKKRIKIEYSI